jgi:quercetin dioxygenase-like cupin family protein
MYRSNRGSIEPKKTPSGLTVWWLIREEDGAPHFEMRYFEVEPSKASGGTVHDFEHEVFVVRGKGTIIGDDDVETNITAGDAVLIRPGEKHKIVNTGGEPLGFICIIPKGVENEIK